MEGLQAAATLHSKSTSPVFPLCPSHSVAVSPPALVFLEGAAPGVADLRALNQAGHSVCIAPEQSSPHPLQVGECIGMFQRPSFETPLYPYLPAHITRPKEIRKLYVLPLDVKCYFAVSAPSVQPAPCCLHSCLPCLACTAYGGHCSGLGNAV